MAYLLVLVVAAAVGAAAFRATLREGVATAAARAGSTQPVGVPVSLPEQSYVPVTDFRSTWESRLTGALGLVIAVIVGAVALALGTYLGVLFLVKLLDRSVA
jgi:hypothetical protein